MNIKRGDTVKILIGKDRGKAGKVLNIFTNNNRISVSGVNVYKKHTRVKRQGEKGEIITLIRPIQISNAQIICPSCSRGTRIGHRLDGNIKARYCKKCNATI